MFREDEYAEAIKGSSVHAYENKVKRNLLFKKLFSLTTLAVVGYVGFDFYQNKNALNENHMMSKVASSQIEATKYEDVELKKIASIDEEFMMSNVVSPQVEATDESVELEKTASIEKTAKEAPTMLATVEDDYLKALDTMEVDVLVDTEIAEVNASKNKIKTQMELSQAMNSILDESNVESSVYTQELNSEIIGEGAIKEDSIAKIESNTKEESSSKDRVVIVKKGDTLAGISKKVYGNEMKYKKIMASNNNIVNDPSMIYVGQEITLPY